ncbi:hypothetical protein TNCV_203841 [Trichonephila clavipes]|nr:hypothetical protein TNCV_203841 [Trichonephila clavipes]
MERGVAKIMIEYWGETIESLRSTVIKAIRDATPNTNELSSDEKKKTPGIILNSPTSTESYMRQTTV